MGSSNDDCPYRSRDGEPLVRRYLIRAAKMYLRVACWTGIVAALLIYGPPAMTVPTVSGTLRTAEAVDAAFGILLSTGTATFLTIVLVVGVLAYIDRRHAQRADRQQHEAADSTEDESHA